MNSSEIRDGYGDSDDQVLGQYEGWLRGLVHALVPPGSPLVEDYKQEARLAMWQVLRQHRNAPNLPRLLTNAGRWRIKSLLEGRPMTGEGNRQGADPHRRKAISSVEAMQESPGAAQSLHEALGAVEAADSVAMAYHHGEILQALQDLSPAQRRYVAMRFWEGMTHDEMKVVFGYYPSGLWSSLKNGARLKLARTLAHLEGS